MEESIEIGEKRLKGRYTQITPLNVFMFPNYGCGQPDQVHESFRG
jgi:hypothetical protein